MKTSQIIILIAIILVGIGSYFVFGQNMMNYSQSFERGTQYQNGFNNRPMMNIVPNSYTNQTTQSSTTTTTVDNPGTLSVIISNFAFSPSSIIVKRGTTVTWTNQDGAPHTVTGDNGGPASPNLNRGSSYTYTFNTTGVFPYHCAIHPNMKGGVTVTE